MIFEKAYPGAYASHALEHVKVERLNEGASHTLRFNSKSEGGGEISAELDGTVHEREFGYFTPNLTDNYEIMLKDDGSIWINEGVDN